MSIASRNEGKLFGRFSEKLRRAAGGIRRRLVTRARADNAWDRLMDETQHKKFVENHASSLRSMHDYYNRRVMGHENLHYLHYFLRKYLSDKPGLVVGSFGSGGGHLERSLLEMGFPCEKIEGYELNPRLVESSNAKAIEIGAHNLEYFEADLNNPNLPVNRYDLGIFFHSLHHVERVDACVAAAKASLKDDGLLLVVDFVGPTQHQWTDQQLSIAQSLLQALPKRYRVIGKGPRIKNKLRRPSVREVVRADPSEAIRSEDLLPALRAHFVEIELKSLGGTILNHIFDGIASNFDEEREEDRRLIRVLQDMEQWFEDFGYLTPNYVFGVYSKK
ncbi:class I SAM-dependent methyltransferase [Burkholderia cenocepacia]|uniref:class I SAM-dependent methyltransferase n=1 Tax=Burkholderia cenocepacia TaxID=95486 RepID=UPI0024B778A6|nr:class I SAM-dependent methyltransferase [Burkholderia cenocepacia]MDI9679449.1 class I SAM-dependent methyltransferase [Burkholderia cenocepacia]